VGKRRVPKEKRKGTAKHRRNGLGTPCEEGYESSKVLTRGIGRRGNLSSGGLDSMSHLGDGPGSLGIEETEGGAGKDRRVEAGRACISPKGGGVRWHGIKINNFGDREKPGKGKKQIGYKKKPKDTPYIFGGKNKARLSNVNPSKSSGLNQEGGQQQKTSAAS